MEKKPTALTEKIAAFEQSDRDRILKAAAGADEHAADAASTLIDLGLDADTVIAALALGSAGNRPPPESVEAQFGASVAQLVNGVAKIERLSANSKTIREAQNIRDMIFALSDDIRVILIRLAEKLSVLRVRNASGADEDRKAQARECLDIYAPLANRLGIYWLKDEMEDLSLKFLNREAYQQIKNLVAQKREQRGEFLAHVQTAIRAEAEAAQISVDVFSRAKHFYSVYMKMRKRGISAENIYDLSGIRIICDSIENCYTLLGLVHRLWKPISGTFDDYVAKPKPNGYQSLHTSVMAEWGGEERRLEIQIRTREMHQIAENGVASHWLYKRGSSRDMVHAGDVDVVNRLKKWQAGAQAGEGEEDWLEEIKREILRDSIYVLTPQAKVIRLPAGATPIDFAYHIHSAIGEHCIGAKANGSIIPLSSELKNTQIVEILTSPSAHPHFGWLEVAKTSRARNKIRSWLEQHDESLIAEKTTLEKKKPTAEPPAPPVPEKETPFVQQVLQPLTSVLQVRIEDEKNMLVHFARCCNPVTGDPIIGYVSRGRGIIIHRENCSNLANINEYENRRIDAKWEDAGSALVKHFRIDARHTANLFSEIEGAIRRRQGHLIEGRLEETPKEEGAKRLTGFFTIQMVRADDLKSVIKNIRGIPGIIGIQQIN